MNEEEQTSPSIAELIERVVESLPVEVRQRIDQVLNGEEVDDTDAIDSARLRDIGKDMSDWFEKFDFPPSDDAMSSLALSWWATVERQSKAVRSLYDAGLNAEALANVRVAFEYAMALAELSTSDHEQAVLGIFANTMRDFARLNRVTEEENIEYREAVDNAAAGLKDVLIVPWSPDFAKRAKKLGLDSVAKYYYGTLSMFIHPTLFGVFGFSDFTNDAAPSKTPNVIVGLLTGTPLLWAVQCQCWASLAVSRILQIEFPW